MKPKCPVCGSSKLETDFELVRCLAYFENEVSEWDCGWSVTFSESEIVRLAVSRGAPTQRIRQHLYNQRSAIMSQYGEQRYSESFVRLHMSIGDRRKVQNINARLAGLSKKGT